MTACIVVFAQATERVVDIFYLEIVSPNVDQVCSMYEAIHGVVFDAPEPGLGGARTASLANGGLIGIRAPMRADETPIVRPYLLVDDIEEAVRAAEEAGALVAHPPFEILGRGTFAILIQGGVQHGLWQV